MGYELQKLQNLYGVSDPTLSYMGTAMPVRPEAPTALKSGATADEQTAYNKAVDTYNTGLANYNTNLPKYQEDQKLYNQYRDLYSQRMLGTKMYDPAANRQFLSGPVYSGADANLAAAPRYTQSVMPASQEALPTLVSKYATAGVPATGGTTGGTTDGTLSHVTTTQPQAQAQYDADLAAYLNTWKAAHPSSILGGTTAQNAAAEEWKAQHPFGQGKYAYGATTSGTTGGTTGGTLSPVGMTQAQAQAKYDADKAAYNRLVADQYVHAIYDPRSSYYYGQAPQNYYNSNDPAAQQAAVDAAAQRYFQNSTDPGYNNGFGNILMKSDIYQFQPAFAAMGRNATVNSSNLSAAQKAYETAMMDWSRTNQFGQGNYTYGSAKGGPVNLAHGGLANLSHKYAEGGEVAGQSDLDAGNSALQKQDYKTAAEYFTKAAQAGNGNAQNNLGVLYAQGTGVPRNDVEAAKWMLIANQNGYGDIGKNSNYYWISQRMPESQINAAKQGMNDFLLPEEAKARLEAEAKAQAEAQAKAQADAAAAAAAQQPPAQVQQPPAQVQQPPAQVEQPPAQVTPPEQIAVPPLGGVTAKPAIPAPELGADTPLPLKPAVSAPNPNDPVVSAIRSMPTGMMTAPTVSTNPLADMYSKYQTAAADRNATAAQQRWQADRNNYIRSMYGLGTYTPDAVTQWEKTNVVGKGKYAYAKGGAVKTNYAEGDLVDLSGADDAEGTDTSTTVVGVNPSAYDALLAKYKDVDPDKIAAARADYRAKQQALVDQMSQYAATQKAEKPDKSEMYFRLAQAFLTPGKTGSFGEGLAQAGGVMADYQKDLRAQRRADAAAQLQLGMKQNELLANMSQDDLQDLEKQQAKTDAARQAIELAQIKAGGTTSGMIPELAKYQLYRQKLLDSGVPENDPQIQQLDEKIKLLTTRAPTAAASSANLYTDDAVTDLANRYLQGDASALTGLGRSTGAMARIQNKVAELVRANGGNATDISRIQQQFKTQQRVLNDFNASTPNSSGGTISAMNTVVGHINHLIEAANALDRGDNRTFNTVKTMFENEFNEPLPNDINLIAQLVSNELEKASSGTAGGVGEREALKNAIASKGANAKLIASAGRTGLGLANEKLKAKRQQWVAAKLPADQFDDFLTEDTKTAIKNLTPAAPPARPANVPANAGYSASRHAWFWKDASGKVVSVAAQ